MLIDRLKPRFSVRSNTVHLISLSCNTVPPEKYGGIELIIANLAKGLVSKRLKTRVYSPGALDIDGCDHSQTLLEPTKGIQQGVGPNSQEHLLRVESELRSHCRSGDVVIFNHAEHFRFLKKRLGALFFARVRCYEIAHWLDAGLYRNIIYPSEALQKFLRKDGFVIPHGEDLKYSEDESARGDHLFYAGRLTEDKGLELSVAACEQIGCRLRVAGPEANTAFFGRIVSHPNVDFLGELTYAQLVEEYQQAKAFIYMTQYEEPFGLAVVEAMAAGCPVITTGRGGTGETVLDGKTGFFCSTAYEIREAYGQIENLRFSDVVSRAKRYSVDNMVDRYFSLITRGKLDG